MKVSKGDAAFFGVLGAAVLTAVVWLAAGLLPAIGSASPSFHDALHRWGRADGFFAEIALNAAHTSHSTQPGGQVVLDYLFSVFNLGLGLFVVKLRPRDRTARLLAFALIGTSVAFNLQGHDALQVVPPSILHDVNTWHISLHVLSGLAYIFALLLFPEGRLRARPSYVQILRLPLLVLVGLVFTGLSLITTDDHTLGLVIVFGICIPIAGLVAQSARYVRSADHQQRQQSRVLLGALVLAVGVALPLALFTTSSGGGREKTTVDYEVSAPAAGIYFFRCDPHPVDMIGTVRVTPSGGAEPEVINVSAEASEFSTDTIELPAGRESVIRFTNYDTDPHNVAIYRDASANEPLFIGAEFSASNSAVFAFRVFRLVFAVIPIALFVGLIRFRLWDVDQVITRTVVYGLLAGFITLLYLAVVVGIGTALGAGRRGNLVLSIVVTAIVALAFQPVRDRARRLANRLVYGRRATPYEVLTEFSDRVGDAYGIEEVIPRMAQTIGEGTGARRAEVWLRVGRELLLSASWPEPHGGQRRSVPLVDSGLPEFAHVDRAIGVRHRGELLGALTVTKTPSEPVTPVEDKLLHDVASQAGLVLRNAQLAAELQARLQELRASRQRIVTAQDAERRRIERNIHDGAQQHLVAMGAKLRLAQDLAEKDPARARELLAELQSDTGEALQTLRDLARGIYPPVLADRGLVHALEAHARRCPLEVRIEDRGVGRHSSEIENAAYFCCLEAIQNAIKHAGSGPVTVTLERVDAGLTFSIADPGPGFDPSRLSTGSGVQNMADRVAALGGELTVSSDPQGGTVVTGHVPIG